MTYCNHCKKSAKKLPHILGTLRHKKKAPCLAHGAFLVFGTHAMFFTNLPLMAYNTIESEKDLTQHPDKKGDT